MDYLNRLSGSKIATYPENENNLTVNENIIFLEEPSLLTFKLQSNENR